MIKWHWLPEALFLLLALALEGHRRWQADALSPPVFPPGHTFWSSERKLQARERTRELWYHGFNNYMDHAFPMDELTPLSCGGQGPDWANPRNIAHNDVAGNFSLTLVDVLDTFVILDDRDGFDTAVRNVINRVSFTSNVKPQVFETTIRVLGGLVSAHQFASRPNTTFHLPWYQGELLDLAYDLGSRLLPAFNTPTGLPYARVNLRHGVTKGETPETCTAGAGSLMLEFATLSRLTGDPRFEKVARKAFFALWNRKSDIGLVGNTINTLTGIWTGPEVTGIGAGIDSFYEYALKWYILSGETEFLDVWDDAYAAIMRYSRAVDGFWYRQINMRSGDAAFHTIDSLAAFWPGLQVLAGDVEAAIKLHLLYYNIWRKHAGLPEVYDTSVKLATSHQYPLRPEFVESTWYLYRATRDPFYLDVGERILFDITTRSRVLCGLSGIADLRTNKRDDRMESFALSETLKYLFLLFDEENALHSDDSNYVFTTEGHIILPIPEPAIAQPPKKKRPFSKHQCPSYDVLKHLSNDTANDILHPGIRARSDYDYARELVGQSASEMDQDAWSSGGWCAKPKVDIYAFDVVLSATGRAVPEDLSPSLLKISPTEGGYIVHNITGIRTHIVKRLDGRGFDIRKMGHYTIRPGNLVYINDSSLFGANEPKEPAPPEETANSRETEVTVNFFTEPSDMATRPPTNQGLFDGAPALSSLQMTANVFTGGFGTDLSSTAPPTTPFTHGQALPLYWEEGNTFGCDPFHASSIDGVVVVYRGECTFLEKLFNAKQAGAQGVVVISDSDKLVTPSANDLELSVTGNVDDVFIVVVGSSDGDRFVELTVQASEAGHGKTFIELVRTPVDEGDESPMPTPTETQTHKTPIQDRYLFLNGIPLTNTRLLV